MERKTITNSFFVIFLLVFTVFIGVKPFYNIDMLPYMAIVKKMDGENSIQQIHASTYQQVENIVSAKEFYDLVGATDYRKAIYEDAVSFDEQLPFYIIKPLYLLTSFLFYKAGFTLSFSTVLPSLISFFFIGLILVWWVNKILPSPWLGLWACLFIITSQPLVGLGKSSAPDGMATLFLLAGCYLFIEKRKLWSSTLFFILSILTRPDYVIFVGLIYLVILAGKWYRKVAPMHLLACFILVCGAYLVPKLFLEGGAWSTLFYHAFIERNLFPVSSPQGPTIVQYIAVIGKSIVHSTYSAISYLLLILLFAGTVLWDRIIFCRSNIKDWTFHQTFMLALVACVALRFLLFPAFLDRFMAPFLLLGSIIFMKEVYPWLTIRFNRDAKFPDKTTDKPSDIYVER